MYGLLDDVLMGHDFVWRDITWRERAPVLTVEPLQAGKPAGQVHTLPITPGAFLGVRVLQPGEESAGTYCTGYAQAKTDGPGFTHLPCPSSALVPKGKQCPTCLARDEFAPIHRVHLGAQMTPAALDYVNLEHFLYIATFPDATSKVGTASLHSNPRRLDDQAVATATIIARAQTGIIVRQLEDFVSRDANLSQFKHASTKYRSWVNPLTPAEIKSAHYMAVEAATWALEDAADTISGFQPLAEPWVPSLAMGRAYASLRAENPEPLYAYPSLTEGEHGFYVTGGTGKFLTAHTGNPEETFLVNTATLSNKACASVGGLIHQESSEPRLF